MDTFIMVYLIVAPLIFSVGLASLAAFLHEGLDERSIMVAARVTLASFVWPVALLLWLMYLARPRKK